MSSRFSFHSNFIIQFSIMSVYRLGVYVVRLRLVIEQEISMESVVLELMKRWLDINTSNIFDSFSWSPERLPNSR